MLITIAIAEEIQGSKRITLVPEPSGGPPGLHAQNNKIFKDYGTWAHVTDWAEMKKA